MKIKIWPIFASAALLLAPNGFAGTLTSTTTLGSTTRGENLGYDSKTGGGPNEKPSVKSKEKSVDTSETNWNIGYGYEKSTDASVDDVTHSFSGGLKHTLETPWTFGGGLEYSTTPAESLTSFGPDFNVNHTFYLGESVNNEEQDFNPSIDLELDASFIRYSHTSNPSAPVPKNKKKIVRAPPTETQTIDQRAFAITADLDFLEWLSTNVGFTKYSYNKDVNTFIDQLNSPIAVRRGASGFSSTVSGLPLSSVQLGFTFYFLENWSIGLDGNITKTASNGTNQKSALLSVAREIGEDWKVGVGFERVTSASTKESLFSLDLSYDF